MSKSTSDGVTYFSQDVEFLGFLEAQLRDLHGISTLTYELIQNADDVKDDHGRPGTSLISFDVTDEALIVKNDGVFRNVDFDRLRRVAGGGKRDEAGTTGAFGIGFISVYQITDSPELLSDNRHWTIRPDAETDKRVEQRNASTNGTVFRLPWAFNANSVVRQKLRIPPVDKSALPEIADEIGQAVELAALFLKQLTTLEVRRSGSPLKRLQREVSSEDNQVLIQDGESTLIWQIFEGDFEDEATELRIAHPQIEKKRRSRVRIAIPDETLSQQGRLFATLPSETRVPLPFYIDADFFPTTDRKRIPFDSSYQGEWNRTAIECAARILADNFSQLPALLGPEGLWQLLWQVNLTWQQVESEASQELDESFASFWYELGEYLQQVPIVYTSAGKWVRAREARLLESDAEMAARPVLEALGIPIVNPSLRPYFSLMRQKDIGTPLLSVDDVVTALQKVKLAEGDLSNAPKPLHEISNWRLLWAALDGVLDRSKRTGTYNREVERLKQYPVGLTAHQQLRTPNHIYWADPETRSVLHNIPWLHAELVQDRVPGSLVNPFNVKLAVQYLSHIKPEQFAVAWREGRTRALFQWLDTRRDELLDDKKLVEKLMQVPLFPIDGEFYTLGELYLPGGFDDPLNISLLVDLEAIGGHRAFLEELGIPILDFKTYVGEQVPAILEAQPDLSPDIRFQLVHLISKRLSEIREDNHLRQRLQQLPLISCTNGTVMPAAKVYARDRIRDLLGADTPIATPPPTETIQDFHRWLGIPNEPRPGDLLAHVKRLTDSPPTARSVEYIGNIFGYLGDNWRDWNGQYERMYADLQKRAWLPGKADATKWFRPTELYATFQSYLFESQGNFLNLPRPVQERGGRRSGFLEYLGVKAVPSLEQVVRHLLMSAARNEPVNQEVYRFLNDKAGDDDRSLSLLADKPCLLLDDNRYVLPTHVFWGEHPFGRFRHQLGDQLRQFKVLFDRLGVRDAPATDDYIDVLQTVSEEYAPGHLPLETEAQGVVMSCWEALSSALERGDLYADSLRPLSDRDVIPDDRDKPLLRRPEQLFFEDRAGLAGRFDGRLDKDVLPRPLRAWRAMQAVGVRFLSQVVAIEFLEKADTVSDRLLIERLRERRHLLQRVITSERADSAESFASDILDKLHILRVPRLVIRYRFNAFGRPFYSEAEHVSAIWDSTSQKLYTGGATHDWVSIARELANVVKQAREIGPLAMAFKEILAAEKVADAERLLDEYGYPPLDDKIFATIGSYVVTGLGGLQKPSHADDEDESTIAIDDDTEPVSVEPIEDLAPIVLGGQTNSRQPSLTNSGSKSDSPVSGMRLPPDTSSGDGHRSSPGTGHQPRPVEREGTMLISYVYHGSSGASKASGKAAEMRTSTDEAGIARVMAYERARGRRPEKMPHLNKGYDIYSASPDGEIRYIEVKSLSGHWNRESPARITATQFEFARQHGAQFWLYVVERAQNDDEFRIYPLQAPTSHIDRYAFDYGWREFAEDEGSSDGQAFADEGEEE